MLGRSQKFMPKPSYIAELKPLLSIWNDLPQEFIDKAILSFQKRLDFRVLLQLTFVIETFELLTKKIVPNLIRYF